MPGRTKQSTKSKLLESWVDRIAEGLGVAVIALAVAITPCTANTISGPSSLEVGDLQLPESPWRAHPFYTPDVSQSEENVVAVAVASGAEESSGSRQFSGTSLKQSFYIVFEVRELTLADDYHALYLQKWDGSNFWSEPKLLTTITIPANPVAKTFYNPSITSRPGHVTVSAHYRVNDSGPNRNVVGLKEHDYEIATDSVNMTRIIDAGGPSGSDDVGHNQIVWSGATSTYHVCWTQKEKAPLGIEDDQVYCSKRAATDAAWEARQFVDTGAGNQDHGTVAITASGNRRVAYHSKDATGIDTNDIKLRMYRSSAWFDYDTYTLPEGSPLPQPGSQNHPFVALDASGKIQVAWEDEGATGNMVIKFARCLNSTANGCDDISEWEFDDRALSETGPQWAHNPHLILTSDRAWISYEQLLASGDMDVAVADRCLDAPYTEDWNRSDPSQFGIDYRPEYTNEYGVPHIASRAPGNRNLFSTEIGTVVLRAIDNTNPVQYEGVLYTRPEPSCN